MPIQERNIARQRTRDYSITINGLLTVRSKCVQAIRYEEGDTEVTKLDIAAIDRILINVFGYQGDIESTTRIYRRNPSFKRGELLRLVLAILRNAEVPMLTRELTVAAFERKGLVLPSGKTGKDRINRVRKICQRVPEIISVEVDGRLAWKMECRL